MYDFECTKCGHTFEDMIALSAATPACPECSAETQKLISPVLGKVKKLSRKAEYYTSKQTQDKLAAKAKAEGRIKIK